MEAPDYQVGAHFEALDEGVLVTSLKLVGYFFPFQFAWKCGAQELPNNQLTVSATKGETFHPSRPV